MPQAFGFVAGMVGFGTAGAIATGVATSAWASGWVLGAGIGSTVVGGLVSKLLTSVALSALQQALGPKPPQGGGLTISTTLRGEQNPETILLGRTATGGQAICPPYSHGKSNRYLTHVIEICSAPGAKLERLILNDDYVEIGSEAHADYGLPILGDYEGHAWIRYYDGSQTAADPMLLARYGTHPDRPWTADMVGTGLCYAILTFYYDRENMAQVPRYRFEMSGIPLYDLRKDSTAGGVGPQRLADPATWAQTDNPIVMAWNLLRGIPLPGGEIYGGGEPVTALPAGVWIAAMNACDAPRAKKGGGTEPAWRAGMEAILTQEPASVLGELLKACAGTIADVGYGWKVQVGAPALPVYSFTDDDIIVSKPQDYDPFPGLEETFNAVTAQYPDPESLWESKEAPPRTNAAWEAADAFGRRTADLTLPAVPYKRQVQRLMRAWIEDERRFRRHSLTLPPDASALELLDTADWSSARNGYVSKDFSISEVVEDLRTGLKKVSIRERDPADYDWSAEFELPDTPATPGTTIPVQPVSGFAVAAIVLKDAGGAGRRVALQLGWDSDLDARGLRWRIRLAGTTAIILRGDTQDLAEGGTVISAGLLPATAYEVSARLISGRKTAWTGWLGATTASLKLGPADLDWSQLETEILGQVDALQQWVDGEVDAVVGLIGDEAEARGNAVQALGDQIAGVADGIAAEAEARGNAIQTLADGLADIAQDISDEVARRADNVRTLARNYRRVTRSMDELRDWVGDLDYRRYREKEQLRTDLSKSLREFRATFEETITVAASERAAITQRVTSLEADSLDTRAQILAVDTARVNGEEALAQSIAGLSVGTVNQFDHVKIWYYDDDAEGWTGSPAAPTVAEGYMRPADGAGAYVISPSGLGVRAVRYPQLRARLRRVGSPVWTGYLWWADAGQSFVTGRRVAIPEPVWSGDEALITVTPGWAATVDRVRLDLTPQDASNHVLVDWIAIGRPAPGATSAELVEERTARLAADNAQAAAILDMQAGITDVQGNLAATAGAVDALTIEVAETGAAVASQATALTELQTEVAGKASADAVAALESRTSATETAVKTGSAATTSLRASLLPLASEVLDQGFADFLARRKARKAMVAADQSLTAQIRAVDDRLILTADAVTRLELDLPKLASATAVDALQLRVTTAEGRITSQGEAITALNTALPGKASASALEALTSRVALTESGIVSLGQSVTDLGTAVAGKAGTDVVAALESRTSATETAVKTGGAATTSLRASLLPLASEVLDQGFADFLARRKVRKAVAEADQSLTAQIRAVDDRLILTADAVTRLQLDLPNLASATAVDALRLRVTTAEGRITSQGEAITALNTALPGKASASALEALTSRVTLTESGIVSLGQSVTDLGTEVAGKAGTDVVAALESRTSKTEAAVKTGGAATTSLRASLLPLASEVLDQGFAEFLTRRKVRKAVAEADQSLTAQIRAVDDRLILTADAVTRLQLDLPNLASATAVDTLRLRVTTAEGRITSQGEAISALNTALPGKASASALDALTTRVTLTESRITSQAEAITALDLALPGKASASALDSLSLTVVGIGDAVTAQGDALQALDVAAGKYSAGGRFRTTVEATPEGATARIGLSVAAASDEVTATAALFLEVDSSGASSVLIRADRFAVVNGAAKKALFVVEGSQIYLQTAMIKAASIGSLEIAGNAVTIPVRTFAPKKIAVNSTDWVTVASLRIRRKGFATEFSFSASVDGYGNGTLDFVLTRGSDNTIIRRAGFAGARNGRQTQVSFSSVDWDTGTGMTVYRIRARKPDPSVTAGWNANMRVFRRYFSAVQFQR